MYRNKAFGKKYQRNKNEWRKSDVIPDENNPVIQIFVDFAKELDDKHDTYEKIIKISRDIAIESKRIIFSLHNIQGNHDSNKIEKLDEIKTKFENLSENKFKMIACELLKKDPYLYHRSFTACVQEFVEAYTYYMFLKQREIPNFNLVSKCFVFKNNDNEEFSLFFSQYDYLLGIADLTGELMRRSINSLGLGEVEECYFLCETVRDIFSGFLGTHVGGHKELKRKLYTLKQSLTKMELVCYNLQVRGQEVPKDFIATALEESQIIPSDEDEGYF